jgi:hypothetical protein
LSSTLQFLQCSKVFLTPLLMLYVHTINMQMHLQIRELIKEPKFLPIFSNLWQTITRLSFPFCNISACYWWRRIPVKLRLLFYLLPCIGCTLFATQPEKTFYQQKKLLLKPNKKKNNQETGPSNGTCSS